MGVCSGNRYWKIIFGIILVLTLSVAASPSVLAFPDVENHWAEHDIALLSAKGLIGGYPDGSFRPEAGISRAEFARLLISALNMDESAWALETSSRLFRDVPEDHWARGYIQLAWELGIVSGYKDGTFRPEQVINRAEMAALLLRVLRYVGDGDSQVSFKDELPDWAEESILLAAKWGLVSGFEDGTFRPLEPVTRSQAVVFLNRILAARGAQYELYGRVLRLEQDGVVVEIGGVEHTLPLAEDVYIVYENQMPGREEADKELPLTGYLAFNRNNLIAFIRLVTETADGEMTVGVSSGGNPVETVSGTEVTNMLTYSLEEVSEEAREIVDPAESLEITKRAMGIPELVQATGAEGEGQVIAVIDSGVDPGHPDLQWTADNRQKIIGWANFTDDGRVELPGIISAAGSALSHQGLTYRLPSLPSQSGTLRFGFLEESSQGVDFNLNGSTGERFLVVAADTEEAGVYDTVIVDTDGDRDLEDELQLKEYEDSQEYASFRGLYDRSFNLVVCNIAPSGEEVLFGYDQLGHGTQVAGVAAANGMIQGVAPGARLLVAKVLDGEGVTEWTRLADAIRWATDQGADIINLSLGYYQDGSAGNNTLTKLVDDLSEQGIIFTIAAGNQGPGIGTLATPGNARKAISVGAYITPEMWLNDYGYTVDSPTLWYFSSAGPRQDGLTVPTIVAPGSAVSTWPLSFGSSYRLGEGTSIAAAHVAGAVAVLLDSAANRGIQLDADSLKKLLADSSRTLPGMTAAETGYGIFDVEGVWELLKSGDYSGYPLRGYAYNRLLGFGEGLFSREIMPGEVPYYVINMGEEEQVLFWSSSADWLKPLFQVTYLPFGSRRELPVEYVLPDQPGIYTGWLEGKLLTSQYPDIRLMTTVIKPYLLYEDNGYRQEFSGVLPAGQYKRYFVKVPDGAATLQLSLAVPGSQGSTYEGRVRFHVNRPDGSPYGISDWTGLAANGDVGKEWSSMMIEEPEAGIWEIVVYSSAALSSYGREDSRYRLNMQLTGVTEASAPELGNNYLVSVVPKPLVPGKPNYITVHVRDRDTLRPVTGLITINDQLYQIRNGQVTLTVVPREEQMSLEISF